MKSPLNANLNACVIPQRKQPSHFNCINVVANNKYTKEQSINTACVPIIVFIVLLLLIFDKQRYKNQNVRNKQAY